MKREDLLSTINSSYPPGEAIYVGKNGIVQHDTGKLAFTREGEDGEYFFWPVKSWEGFDNARPVGFMASGEEQIYWTDADKETPVVRKRDLYVLAKDDHMGLGVELFWSREGAEKRKIQVGISDTGEQDKILKLYEEDFGWSERVEDAWEENTNHYDSFTVECIPVVEPTFGRLVTVYPLVVDDENGLSVEVFTSQMEAHVAQVKKIIKDDTDQEELLALLEQEGGWSPAVDKLFENFKDPMDSASAFPEHIVLPPNDPPKKVEIKAAPLLYEDPLDRLNEICRLNEWLKTSSRGDKETPDEYWARFGAKEKRVTVLEEEDRRERLNFGQGAAVSLAKRLQKLSIERTLTPEEGQVFERAEVLLGQGMLFESSPSDPREATGPGARDHQSFRSR